MACTDNRDRWSGRPLRGWKGWSGQIDNVDGECGWHGSARTDGRRQRTPTRLERILVDVVHLVGGRQHLALVDVVDPEPLENLRLDEVADPGLGHDGDGDGSLDG